MKKYCTNCKKDIETKSRSGYRIAGEDLKVSLIICPHCKCICDVWYDDEEFKYGLDS